MAIILQQYLIELSRYALFALMAIYTICSFVLFAPVSQKAEHRLYAVQNMLMLLLLFLCFLDLTFATGNVRFLYLFAFLLLFLFVMILLVTLIYEDTSRLLLNNMCLLLGVGLCTISRLSFARAYRQYLIALFSFGICLVVPLVFQKVRFFKKLTWGYAACGVGILSVVLLLGRIHNGSKITFTIAGLTFQPSEFIKILYIFFLAAVLWEHSDFKWVLISGIIAGIHVVILVLSKDLGSALIYYVAFVLIVVMITGNNLFLIIGTIGGIAASAVAYRLFGHVKVRFLAWKDPWTYIENKGYQIGQSLFAIGSGRWFGTGLTMGNSKDIPFVEQDAIFSAICEEFGVLFAICILLVSLNCFLEMMRIAINVGDRFYKIICYGCGITYIFQIFLTVGGGIKFIPLTGVTLPLISAGGTSCLVTMLMFFIVQGINIRHKAVERKKAGIS